MLYQIFFQYLTPFQDGDLLVTSLRSISAVYSSLLYNDNGLLRFVAIVNNMRRFFEYNVQPG